MLTSLLYWARRRLSAVQVALERYPPKRRGTELLRGLRVAEGLLVAALALAAVRWAALFIDGVEERVSTSSGFEMHLDLTDALQLYIFLFGVWEPSTTALVERLVGSGDVVIDVGAHVGYYSLLASRLGAKVSAFEADPEMANRLKMNVEINDLGSVEVQQVAVASDQSGRVLHRGPRHNRGLSSTSPRWNLSDAGTVDSARLSDLVDPTLLSRVCLVKIDVEGAEPDVLAGMEDMWSQLSPDAVVLLEVSPRWWSEKTDINDLLGAARAEGFQNWTIENSYSPLRYLTPSRHAEPVPVKGELSNDVRRHDLVLARRRVWD